MDWITVGGCSKEAYGFPIDDCRSPKSSAPNYRKRLHMTRRSIFLMQGLRRL